MRLASASLHLLLLQRLLSLATSMNMVRLAGCQLIPAGWLAVYHRWLAG